MKNRKLTAVLVAALFLIICVVLFLINRVASEGANDEKWSAGTGVESTTPESTGELQSNAAVNDSVPAADSRADEGASDGNTVNPDGQTADGSNAEGTQAGEGSAQAESEPAGVTVTDEFTIELQENEAVGGF